MFGVFNVTNLYYLLMENEYDGPVTFISPRETIVISESLGPTGSVVKLVTISGTFFISNLTSTVVIHK